MASRNLTAIPCDSVSDNIGAGCPDVNFIPAFAVAKDVSDDRCSKWRNGLAPSQPACDDESGGHLLFHRGERPLHLLDRRDLSNRGLSDALSERGKRDQDGKQKEGDEPAMDGQCPR
jgi:hypothetical protein